MWLSKYNWVYVYFRTLWVCYCINKNVPVPCGCHCIINKKFPVPTGLYLTSKLGKYPLNVHQIGRCRSLFIFLGK